MTQGRKPAGGGGGVGGGVGGYGVTEFANKHGLTEKSAQIILIANGPSRERCDAAAESFKEALGQRRAKRLTDRLKLE